MNQCKSCQTQIKNWSGDDTTCAFESGIFDEFNWNCGTIRRIRKLLSGSNTRGILLHDTGDQKYGTISLLPDSLEVVPYVDIDGIVNHQPVCLWVGWYKNRGSTEGMYLMFDSTAPRKPTLDECNSILDYYSGKYDGKDK